ncbi:MAG: hypothetical protein WC630_04740 [Candidatus Babeliales bacterium]|jgi:hypothetical protein
MNHSSLQNVLLSAEQLRCLAQVYSIFIKIDERINKNTKVSYEVPRNVTDTSEKLSA